MKERGETGSERAWREFKSEIRSRPAETLDLVEVERSMQEHLNALGAELTAEILERADTTAAEVLIDGQRWGNRRLSAWSYIGVFGAMTIKRSIYQQAGRGKVAVPLDLRLGMVEGTYTPRMARIMAQATSVMTDEDAASFLLEVGTAVVSKATISRIPQAMAARYERRREVVEANLRATEPIPAGAVTVQVALDGVMVPQDGELAKARGRKTSDPEPPRHEQRYGPIGTGGPAANDSTRGRAWHEGSVGTIAFLDAAGTRLRTIYLARMPEPFKATLAEHLEAELMGVLSEQPSMNIVYASDGAAQQWKTLEQIASRVPTACTGTTLRLVDAFHVAEYIQKAADAIDGTGTKEARIQAATWRETVKTSGGAARVLRSMRAQLAGVPTEARRAEVENAIGYIAHQNDEGRMEYSEAIDRNFPIGTGITEAAAKTVVGVRMKRAGSRFSQHGGQTVMTFRAALLSGRFEALHQELGATYRKSVKNAA
jgi:hypothetical protein